MNKKELIKIFFLICAILSTLLIIITDVGGELGIIILFLMLFIFALPIAYLYKYNEFKTSRYKKLLNIGVIIIIIGWLILLGYLLANYYHPVTVSSFDVNIGNSYNSELDLSLGYLVSDNNDASAIIIVAYIILLFTLLLISFDDLLIKTNKTNYILTMISSLIIIIVNISYFNPHLNIINNISNDYPFNFVRQFDIYIVLILGLIISHKFINKEKDV